MALFNSKKYHHKLRQDEGKSFGKSFNYEYGRNKAKTIAEGKGKGRAFRKALENHK